MLKQRFFSLFFLLVTLLVVAAALYIYNGQDTKPNVLSSGQPTETDLKPGLIDEAQIYLFPHSPAPGDYLVVEVGPLPAVSAVSVQIDFPGTVSTVYRVDNFFYTIIAIGFDARPGRHNLSIIQETISSDKELLTTEVKISVRDYPFSRFSMPASRTAGWTSAQLAIDRENVRIARETTEPYPLWVQPFVRPLEGRISSEFGAVRVINENPPRRHNGIDIVADEGTPVIAANSGIVRLAHFLLSGGYTVIIDHGLGLSSTYMHLHTIAVEENQFVSRGQLIGTVGMTGYATGPHLHYEVNIEQTPVNPEQLINNELLLIPPAYVEARISRRR